MALMTRHFTATQGEIAPNVVQTLSLRTSYVGAGRNVHQQHTNAPINQSIGITVSLQAGWRLALMANDGTTVALLLLLVDVLHTNIIIR